MKKKYGTLQNMVVIAVVYATVAFLYDYFVNDTIDFIGLGVKTIIFAPVFSLLMKKIKG